eukprot:TRINITY_DN19542_c0_g4_i1.p1 TRINITY_DN19542_c0_g4~~TRINITY_DN19542_c0_g4_i1.p1  ORF type:complete len:744 (+),score=218.34 TRINITY_DN19542_c0_g4_i1:95-2326(+)
MAPKAKKPVYATADEVIEAREELDAQIKEVQGQATQASQAVEQRLQTALQTLTAKVDTMASRVEVDNLLADARAFTQSAREDAEKLLTATKTALEELVQGRSQGLQKELQKVEKDLKKEIAKTVSELTVVVDEELQGLKKSLQEEVQASSAQVVSEFKAQRGEIDAAIKEGDGAVAGTIEANREAAASALKQAQEVLEQTHQAHVERNTQIHKRAGERLDRHDRLLDEHAAAAKKALDSTSADLSRRNDQLREDTADRFDYLDREFEKLRMAIEEVENVNTRRVDWVINGISRYLAPDALPNDLKHRSLFSPRFNMGGCHGLQLELQYLKPSDPREPGSEAGDAAVFLWACKGTTLAYRLYIGSRYQSFEKTFNGRMPFGTTRFCYLKDQIDRTNDSLKVSVEVLESHREIEKMIEPECKLERPIGLKVDAPEYDGIVRFHRYINHQTLDLVKNQVDLMRSRLVRRVEWRVEQASRLKQCFGAGEPLCSPPFTAAGLEGLQLVFYPSGYFGANDGYCSLFLFGPAGASVKCNLMLGPQKREASHVFTEAGCFGRANFCRFEQTVDASEDTVLVGIEINEAHQDTVATTSHPTTGDGPISAVESTVKLRESPGKNGPLEATQVLPSIWTAAFEKSITQAPDGMHSFDELKARAARGGGGDRSSPKTSEFGAGELGSTGGGRRRALGTSGSSPALGGTWNDTRGSAPLPRLDRTVGSIGFGSTGGGPGGRSRRQKSFAIPQEMAA